MVILRILILVLFASGATVVFASGADNAEQSVIVLPAPGTEGGKPLMQALNARQSLRSFHPRELPDQVLGDLLWAAAGYNRPELKKRTVPSARNWQEVDVYVVMKNGAYLYVPDGHRLVAVAQGDLRKLTGTQDFVATAPLNLVFVADTMKMTGSTQENRDLYMGMDAGFISQNVYLFCASEGLATVVRAMLDREALAAALGLSESQKVLYAQTIGYPAKRIE